MTYAYKIGNNKPVPFTTMVEASRAYRAYLDSRDLGKDDAPKCTIFDPDGNETGYISYNGRVWNRNNTVEPIYCPSQDRKA